MACGFGQNRVIAADEIDAIGAKRGSGGPDGGASERELGLLQLLAEMDGFARDDKILVIGATNRIQVLDPALLRYGRFDRRIHMGTLSAPNRLAILKVCSKVVTIACFVKCVKM